MTSEGLTRLLRDAPVRSAYVEAQVGATLRAGGYGRLEGGIHPWERVGFFGFGQVEQRPGLPFDISGGLGARWTWDW